MFITEPSRQIRIVSEYDTVVAGGGIAGISAALAAARNGARVLLIEREFALGGLATLGLVTIYLPLCDGCGKQVSYGIAEELLRLSISRGSDINNKSAWLYESTNEQRGYQRYEANFNPNIFAIDAGHLLEREGVDILYGTLVSAVRTEGSRITHVILENKSGRCAIAVKNVVDATGDADICHLSGEDTVLFGQGNIPAAWNYSVENGKFVRNMLGACDIPDSEKTPEQLKESACSVRFSGLDAKELSTMTSLAHKNIIENFLKKGNCTPEHTLATIPTIPQVRMTRRIAGNYTQHDTEMHRVYEDSVGLFSDWRKKGPVYELPFGALHGAKVNNLLTAGRCISVTDAMWDITRVIPVCAVSGQAAGTAAALADDFTTMDISLLQSCLRQDGVKLHEKEL